MQALVSILKKFFQMVCGYDIKLLFLILVSLTTRAYGISSKIISPNEYNYASYKTAEAIQRNASLNNAVFNIPPFIGTPAEILTQKHRHYHIQNYPLFGWDIVSQINEETRTQIAAFNENNKDVIDTEKLMQIVLQPYNNWLVNRYKLMVELGENAPHGVYNISAMLNKMGGSSKHYCPLTEYNFTPYLLLHFPPQNGKVVVDLGSGWGSCSKQLALLGYTVYSVDIDQGHLNFQKSNFCTIPDHHTFIHNHWKIYDSKLVEDKRYFQEHCRDSSQNIKYILGDFAKDSLLNKIENNSVDILLVIDSMQFISDIDQRFRTLKLFDKKLKKNGILFVKSPTQYQYTFDIKAEILHNPVFRNYKVLTAASLLKEANGKDRSDQLNVLSLQKQ